MKWGNKWGELWGAGDPNYEDAANDRLLEQFKSSANLKEMIAIVSRRWDRLAYIARQVEGAFVLDSAEGVQLDLLGRILTLDRGTNDDDRYRIRLRAFSFLIIPGGRNRIARILEIIRTLTGDDGRDIDYSEAYPMGYVFQIDDVTASEEQDLLDFLPFTRPACYQFWLVLADSDGFVYDDADGIFVVEGGGYSDSLDLTVGAGYGTVVEVP
jgi:hypothetical protein